MKILNMIFATSILSLTLIPFSMAESQKNLDCKMLDNQKICGKDTDGKAILIKDMTGMAASSCEKYKQKNWKGGCKCTCDSGDLMISWKDYKDLMSSNTENK